MSKSQKKAPAKSVKSPAKHQKAASKKKIKKTSPKIAAKKTGKPPRADVPKKEQKQTRKSGTGAVRAAVSARGTNRIVQVEKAANGNNIPHKNGRHPHGGKQKAAVPLTSAQRASLDHPEIQVKLKELIKLAKEQGYLTFDDLNESLPESVNEPEEMEAIITRLRGMEFDIIDASDVDRYKDGKKDQDEEEEEKPEPKLDILDDPVRMYLKQMGQVPLLTREQEVEISKRIEEAELMVQKHINRFGFIAQAYLVLADKLREGRERFDRVILDKKIESRERYLKQLPRLCENLKKR